MPHYSAHNFTFDTRTMTFYADGSKLRGETTPELFEISCERGFTLVNRRTGMAFYVERTQEVAMLDDSSFLEVVGWNFVPAARERQKDYLSERAWEAISQLKIVILNE